MPPWDVSTMAAWKPNPNHKQKEPDYHCNGKVRGECNRYCTKIAGWGTKHVHVGRCKFHGGNTPGWDVKAQKIQAELDIEQYGLSREVDPHTALLEELYRTAGHVAWLHERVAELDTNRMHGPVGGSGGGIPEHKPHIWVTMYKDERTHLTRVAKTCVDAGIEERRIQIAEEQGELIARAINGILKELGVADEPNTPSIVRKHLLLLGTGDEDKQTAT